MDFAKVLVQLRRELDQLNEAIQTLEQLRSVVDGNRGKPRRPGRLPIKELRRKKTER